MITAEYLRSLLDYDPDTGVFTWAARPARRVAVGSTAGSSSHGYIRIQIGERGYPAHRLAWLYMTGEWPGAAIDHRDCDRSNNRWSNLRLASPSQNKMNTRRYASNTSGFKGVSWHKERGKWRADIRANGRRRHLGVHDTPEAAHEAYVAAAKAIHGEFARPS